MDRWHNHLGMGWKVIGHVLYKAISGSRLVYWSGYYLFVCLED